MSVNPDLERERAAATFDPTELTYILDGNNKKTRRRRYLEHLIHADSEFDSPDPRFQSREDEFGESLRKHVAFVQRVKSLGIKDQEEVGILNGAAMDGGAGPLSMHFAAFMPPIRLMASEEQKKKWMPLAESCQIIGCYAQTELGHGSFVRGIETRADYDANTQEFILSTPTISATKWWSGSLGVCATHTVLMAQLYSQGKCHGLHPFIVQVRDLDTHRPMPGVVVGDIGPKFGFSTIDNGFLRLNNVRIPRDQLLHKAGVVLPDGSYQKPQSAKLVYGGMLGIRARLASMAAYLLSKAITIAIRYSAVRHQSEIKPGGPEPQVLDYQTQQHKLLPILAGAYAYHFVGQWMVDFHEGVMKEIHQGDFSRLPEDHVLAAGFKAVINWKAHENVELCRLSCGGHGYSQASGLPRLYGAQVANSTAEGETTVLLLQTAKYMAKCAMDIQQGKKLDPSVTYLGQAQSGRVKVTANCDRNLLLQALQFRSRKCVENMAGRLQKTLMETGDQNEALNNNLVVMVDTAKAHVEAVIMGAFVSKVDSVEAQHPDIAKVLNNLCLIYGITEILANAGDYLQHGYLLDVDVATLKDRLYSLYALVRPQAVALVDAFDVSDRALGSILGRYDGNVYENLFNWARDSPLNKDEVHESYKYLKTLKQAKL